ncbi:MAG: hypothetical protein Q7T10_16110 [Rhodoferax sp.]|uniref:hypothetical protein n=1 Tax=Rhodoferax sp. TaxID=50421 RepID=UPI00271AD7D3|nr:hypothetical protein [Rhodoferax sp.]MDO8450323.1 hypothetical protein [Rhodoferax sp.]
MRAYLTAERFQIEKTQKMKLRKLLFVVVVAFLAATAIGYWSVPMSYPEKLIRLQVEERLGKIDKRIADEPLAVQALLLDYAADAETDVKSGRGELVLKAWVALLKYPAQSREVLQLFGAEPAFQAILREHGESVIPVIKYFLDNDLPSVKLIAKAGDVVAATIKKVSDAGDEAKKFTRNFWGYLNGNAPAPASPPPVPAAPQSVKVEFGSMQRGWYAVNSINGEGHKFLGQFALDAANVAHWNQVDRTVTTVASFLTGGVSNLERKYELDEKIGAGDVFFAAIDVIPFVAAAKLLKAGKVAAATGKELSFVGKTRAFGARLIPKNPMLVKMGKYGVVLGTGYVVLTHPALLNSAFAEIANLMGLNPMLVQFVGWFLLISIALYPFFWLLKIAASLILLGLSWLNKSMKKRPARAHAAPLAAMSA